MSSRQEERAGGAAAANADVKTARRLRSRRGVVLVAVLWMIALLSALAMAASTSLRSFAGLLAIDRDRVQAEALIGAGVEVGADLLLKYGGRPLLPVETRFSLRSGEGRVRMSDELGRIDINKAPVETLASLFVGLAAEDAETVARAIVRWRDPADASEAPKPAQKPETTQPRHFERTFSNVDQLAQIPTVPAEYATLIAPFVTVFGEETVNATTASAEVLRLLPQMTEARVERLLEARATGRLEAGESERILGPSARYAKPAGRSVARLEIAVALADGFSSEAEAIIVVLPNDREPFRILAFRQSPRATAYAETYSRRE
ncbi:type II secretion system protein GspK [Methylosinus sp. PW1]|uniref:type II secretion system protein GspK n=1 Tax=Methylosinus sp. PW1 TaxID=107636 RepID=UPI000564B773|nr:type II secretion system protein GspK [Methylosinus sp. PW1]